MLCFLCTFHLVTLSSSCLNFLRMSSVTLGILSNLSFCLRALCPEAAQAGCFLSLILSCPPGISLQHPGHFLHSSLCWINSFLVFCVFFSVSLLSSFGRAHSLSCHGPICFPAPQVLYYCLYCSIHPQGLLPFQKFIFFLIVVLVGFWKR